MSLEADLREYFGEDDRRVVLVGVGNPMRADDGVGPKIIELLEEKPIENVMLLNTETVPESFTGKVTGFKPTHVMLVDAANFRGAAGDTKLITSSQIGGQAVSTHSLPLTIFINVIENDLDIEVILLGIQPITIEFFAPMTPELEAAAVSIANTLYQVLSE
jgi:hydrogenase 3 maturation protease